MEMAGKPISWALSRYEPVAVSGSAGVRLEQRAHGRAILQNLLRHRGYTNYEIERAPTGRPVIRDLPNLSMSVSYGQGVVLAGFAEDRAIGVDIESFGRTPVRLLYTLGVDPSDDAADRGAGFARRWTQLEATAKARNVTLRSLIAELRRGRDLESVCDTSLTSWEWTELNLAWTIGAVA